LVIAANGVVYAMVSYAAVFILLVVVAAEKIRLAMIWLVFPVAFLSVWFAYPDSIRSGLAA
jgi:hypothetical protein